MLCGMRGRTILELSVSLLALAGVPNAKADPNETTRRAAAAFEDGVARFKRSDYKAAARAFLLADELAPNNQAITNAIAAASRANDLLSVAEAAERVLSRGETGALAVT